MRDDVGQHTGAAPDLEAGARRKTVALEFDLPQHRIDEAETRALWPNRLITDYLDDAVARHPDKTAVVAHAAAGGTTLRKSYRQLAQASLRAASRLAALGVGKGDVVSLQLPNRWEFIALYVACGRLGAVCNPLLPVYRSRELRYMLSHAESTVLFIPASFRGFDYVPMVDALRDELPRLRHVIVLDRAADGPADGMFDDANCEASEIAALDRLSRPHANDLAEVLFTSGTTGQPKGVMHTHNTLCSVVREYARALGLDGDDIVLQSSPIAHQAGLLHGVVMPLMLGGGVVLQDVWDADVALGLIEAHRATHIHAATPFLADLAESAALARHDIGSLRRFVCAGAPIPRALARRAAERLRIDVMSSFGMSEIGTATCTRRDDPPERIFGTDGGPFRGIELRIVDEVGRPVAAGTEGRLQLRGMSLFVGYLKRPDLGNIDGEGWFDSGDLARLDAHGYVRITGRSKDLIIRGGQNVPVVEIEEQLFRHPAVSEVAIVGIPDERLGERACAFAVLRPGARLSFEEMVQFLKEAGTATPYLPERLEVIGEMPRTASGKLQKFRLREMATRNTDRRKERSSMTEVSITADFDQPAEAVWAVVRDFCNVDRWLPGIERVEAEDGGRRRRIVLPDGKVVIEQEVARDEAAMALTYVVLDSPMPFTDYRSTMAVERAGRGCTVRWSASLVPLVAEDRVARLVGGLYRGGLKALADFLAAPTAR